VNKIGNYRVAAKLLSRFGLDSLKQTSKEDGHVTMKVSSIKKTIFTILKSFVGSGILFLPKAFQNGGLLFSAVVLSLSAFLSTFCMLRLTECSNVLPHSSRVSYGLLGEKAFGKNGRRAVNVSLVLSQLGFCCTYLIFVEKNLSDIINHLTSCSYNTSPWILILLQIPLYTPLTWVRHIEYFAMTNLIADVLILFGLFYIIYFSIETIKISSAPSSWESFNSNSWALFLGTAVYCFEGIGLILPIYDSMDQSVRHQFPQILSTSISFLLIFYCFFAGVVYIAFGENTQSVVTLNLPNDNINFGTISVQITYSIALIFTYPLMLYPVLIILEGALFSPLPTVTKYVNELANLNCLQKF
jgi:proton-coupled amino acid transporter